MRSYLVGVMAGVALGFVVAHHGAARSLRADQREVEGGGEAGVIEDKFKWKMETGTGASTEIRRFLVKVPAAYGNLVAAVPGGGKETVLWFQGQDGTVRNVVLARPSALHQIEYEP